ncbi:MAG TPA: RpiB/LacA/LacB family sugar-phosphate isomerase [Candidatus Paceibacterota bacterium]|nr:RpiB/LacA/LacB family sugar-phosphate isomerase [Candidatus Paceibacterota bacterium]
MIYLASDHRGFELKTHIKEWLVEWGMEYEDCGPAEYDAQDDYPDFIRCAAEKVAANPEKHKAIVLGASGQGEAMVCNRFTGVRAAVYYGGTHDILTLSREHNDANILSLGAAFIDHDDVKRCIQLWLTTDFTNEERHVRRIKKIDEK